MSKIAIFGHLNRAAWSEHHEMHPTISGAVRNQLHRPFLRIPLNSFFNMQVTPSIFKAYDIRGIVPSTINEAMAEALGKAFGTLAMAEGEKTVSFQMADSPSPLIMIDLTMI